VPWRAFHHPVTFKVLQWMDVLVSILKHHSINTVLKWVDDICFFHVPTQSILNYKRNNLHQYSIYITSILLVMDPLSVPWHLVNIKGQDFPLTVSYMGFLWDLHECMVSLPIKKWLKYLDKVQVFQSRAMA